MSSRLAGTTLRPSVCPGLAHPVYTMGICHGGNMWTLFALWRLSLQFFWRIIRAWSLTNVLGWCGVKPCWHWIWNYDAGGIQLQYQARLWWVSKLLAANRLSQWQLLVLLAASVRLPIAQYLNAPFILAWTFESILGNLTSLRLAKSIDHPWRGIPLFPAVFAYSPVQDLADVADLSQKQEASGIRIVDRLYIALDFFSSVDPSWLSHDLGSTHLPSKAHSRASRSYPSTAAREVYNTD